MVLHHPLHDERFNILAQPVARRISPKVQPSRTDMAFGTRASRHIPKLKGDANSRLQNKTTWRKGIQYPVKNVRFQTQRAGNKPNLFQGSYDTLPSYTTPTGGYGRKESMVDHGWQKNMVKTVPAELLLHPQYGKVHDLTYDTEQVLKAKHQWGGHLREEHALLADMRFSEVRVSEAEKLLIFRNREMKKSAKKTKDIQARLGMISEYKQSGKPRAGNGPVDNSIMGRISTATKAINKSIGLSPMTIVIVFGVMAYLMANSEAFSTFLEHYLVEMGMMKSASWFGSTSWSERMEYPMVMIGCAVMAFLAPMLLALKLVW